MLFPNSKRLQINSTLLPKTSDRISRFRLSIALIASFPKFSQWCGPLKSFTRSIREVERRRWSFKRNYLSSNSMTQCFLFAKWMCLWSHLKGYKWMLNKLCLKSRTNSWYVSLTNTLLNTMTIIYHWYVSTQILTEKRSNLLTSCRRVVLIRTSTYKNSMLDQRDSRNNPYIDF